MAGSSKEPKITVTKDGPYIVSGDVKLQEKLIVPVGKGYVLRNGREYDHDETYALCRCGKSKNHPFCDNSHSKAGFVGTETASKRPYDSRADTFNGPGVDLMDDGRCAVARFCHREDGNAWELARGSDNPKHKQEAIQAAMECPSGRLLAVEKNGEAHEAELEQGIGVLQDPENRVSAGLYVMGGISVESADGKPYEVRNRMALCRCGKSRNKPFCDGTHIPERFSDKS